jgi:hypothetical protein
MAIDLVTRFLQSKDPRPVESQQIPQLAVNMFDVTNTYQDGFTVGERPNDPTKFTSLAQKYYDTEVKQIVLNASFQPTEQGIPLHEYTPEKPYTTPGEPNV